MFQHLGEFLLRVWLVVVDGCLGGGVVRKYETVLSNFFFLLQKIGTCAFKYKQCWGPPPTHTCTHTPAPTPPS